LDLSLVPTQDSTGMNETRRSGEGYTTLRPDLSFLEGLLC